MHPFQPIPNIITLLLGHPGTGDEYKEDDVHHLEHNDKAEDLYWCDNYD